MPARSTIRRRSSRPSAPSRNRRARRGQAGFRSRPSRTGCAIPTPSTPSSFSRLQPLDAVDTPPGARDRGTVIHGAIGDYTAEFAKAAPADPLRELTRLGEKRFKPLADYPEARAFWWPRFERIARWFAQWDHERRAGLAALFAEIRGELEFHSRRTHASRSSAIADRIERRRDGSYAILDYKTGQARTEKQVRTGLAPQLTLEAAILREGKFSDLAPGSVSEISLTSR